MHLIGDGDLSYNLDYKYYALFCCVGVIPVIISR
jgi:hypothetical protein